MDLRGISVPDQIVINSSFKDSEQLKYLENF